MDFLRASSYTGAATTGQDAVVMGLVSKIPIEGRHILLVEDIIDTGKTLQASYMRMWPRNTATQRSRKHVHAALILLNPVLGCRCLDFVAQELHEWGDANLTAICSRAGISQHMHRVSLSATCTFRQAHTDESCACCRSCARGCAGRALPV